MLILANSQAKECVNYCGPGVAALFAATFFRIVGSCPGDGVASASVGCLDGGTNMYGICLRSGYCVCMKACRLRERRGYGYGDSSDYENCTQRHICA